MTLARTQSTLLYRGYNYKRVIALSPTSKDTPKRVLMLLLYAYVVIYVNEAC